jgi:CheY-like chemotaxis protein
MESKGFVVLATDSAAGALALLDDDHDVDIVVSDLSMPDMDGIALIHEARRRRPGLPAVLLTGFATNVAEIALDGAVSGAFSLLRKPIQGEQLADRLAALLEPSDSPQ